MLGASCAMIQSQHSDGAELGSIEPCTLSDNTTPEVVRLLSIAKAKGRRQARRFGVSPATCLGT
jgi:hypothetical protein